MVLQHALTPAILYDCSWFLFPVLSWNYCTNDILALLQTKPDVKLLEKKTYKNY